LVGEFHHPRSKAPAHDHVAFGFAGGASVVYNDPRRFGYMTLAATAALDSHPLFAEIGVEPLGPEFTPARLGALLEGARTPLKSALLDQRRIAGLGNIYVCEALNIAGIAPGRPAGAVSRARLERLVPAIRTVLEAAIAAGGSTLRDFAQPDGELGYFASQFRVYGREGEACPCGSPVRRRVDGGRSTFYCARCQR
jgi:formamidopyrimidine-DNA glycosylase